MFFWVFEEIFIMDGEIKNIKKWNILYPVYINSKKTIAEGRRICVTKACENPTCTEISDCCNFLKIPCAIEVCVFAFFAFLVSKIIFWFVFKIFLLCLIQRLYTYHMWICICSLNLYLTFYKRARDDIYITKTQLCIDPKIVKSSI